MRTCLGQCFNNKPNGFIWLFHLAHSNKYISTQTFCYALPKKQLFKIFSCCLKEPNFHSKKKILILTQRNSRSSKRINFLYLSEKIKFSKQKMFLIIIGKKTIFQTKTFLHITNY